jgi:hypothetical protein
MGHWLSNGATVQYALLLEAPDASFSVWASSAWGTGVLCLTHHFGHTIFHVRHLPQVEGLCNSLGSFQSGLAAQVANAIKSSRGHTFVADTHWTFFSLLLHPILFMPTSPFYYAASYDVSRVVNSACSTQQVSVYMLCAMLFVLGHRCFEMHHFGDTIFHVRHLPQVEGLWNSLGSIQSGVR